MLGGIGLRQHRSCGLVEDLQLSQLRSLKCKVRILNTTFSGRQIGRDVREVVNRVAQAIRNGPEFRALDVHRCNGCVDLGRTAARALPPDASDMAVVAGVAFCGLMSRVLRLLSTNAGPRSAGLL